MLKLIIKFLPYILVYLFILYIIKSNKDLIARIKNFFFPKNEFSSKPGQIYKLCSFCNKKADRMAKKCDNCGRCFE